MQIIKLKKILALSQYNVLKWRIENINDEREQDCRQFGDDVIGIILTKGELWHFD